MTTVPPPKAGLVPDADVSNPYTNDLQLVAAVMEARDCAKPDAEAFIEDRGTDAALRLVSARWSE